MSDLYEELAAEYLWAANRLDDPSAKDFAEELSSEMLTLAHQVRDAAA